MAINKQFPPLKFIGALTVMMIGTLSAHAQFLRTSYFMEGSHYRMQMNPALIPTQGYFNLPVIGSVNATVSSTSLGFQDVLDLIDNGNSFYKSDAFMSRLNDNNNVDVNFSTEILSAGWYKGKNFWSVNVGLRADIGAKVTKSMFGFLNEVDKLGNTWSNMQFDIGGQELDVNSFAEVGMGYAREINSRLTIGGKVKLLLGIGNLDLNINKIYLNANLPDQARIDELSRLQISGSEDIENLKKEFAGYHAELAVDARLESSLKGHDLKSEPGYINGIDLKAKDMGIAGYGFGIDLGASYKLMDNLTVSASVLDVGFISWSKGSTQIATAGNSIHMQGQKYVDALAGVTTTGEAEAIIKSFSKEATGYLNRVGGGDVLNYDMLQLKEEEAGKSRNSGLASTLVVGAEYGLLDNKLGLGVLSTTRFLKSKALAELTFSANYRPKNWLNVALSYSVIQSAGKSFGVGLKIGSFFLGTDYMFLGQNSKSVSGFVGVSIPLGRTKASKEG